MSDVRSFISVTVIAILCAGLLACSGGGGSFVISRLPTQVTVTLSPDAVEAGQNTMGTVAVSPAAPAGGFTVLLSSDNPAATLAAGPPVVIPAGATSAPFTVNTTNVSTQTIANITAMLMPAVNQTSVGAILTVDPSTTAQVQSLQLSLTTVKGGMPITGTVTLTQPPTNPAAVTLTSSNKAVVAFPPAGGGPAVSPASVQVAAGTKVAQFQITTFPVTAQTVVSITATLNNAVIAMVTVTP